MPQTICRVSRQEMLILKRPEGHKHCVSCPRQHILKMNPNVLNKNVLKLYFLSFFFFLKNVYMKMTCQFMLNSSHFIFKIAQEEKMKLGLKPFILMLLK